MLAADIGRGRARLLLPQDPMICSSVNQLGFMVHPFKGDGLYHSWRNLRGSDHLVRATTEGYLFIATTFVTNPLVKG